MAATLAREGVDFFFCISASPGRGVGRGEALGTAKSYDAMTRTYAQLYTSYVVYCNRVGYEDGVSFWGGSRVVGPDGTIIAGPLGRDEGILSATLDIGALRRERIANPLLRDERHNLNDAENDRIRNRRPGD
jgi:predicted amidohydrolase